MLWVDGACQVNLGAGGYLLKDDKGEVRDGGGIYFGDSAKTNNVAETRTMLVALQKTQSIIQGSDCKGLTVFSDSDLLVRFVTKRARPRDSLLVPLVTEIR
jgi:ribonuclease HI